MSEKLSANTRRGTLGKGSRNPLRGSGKQFKRIILSYHSSSNMAFSSFTYISPTSHFSFSFSLYVLTVNTAVLICTVSPLSNRGNTSKYTNNQGFSSRNIGHSQTPVYMNKIVHV